ncbi:family 43 glycosylhydrolase [Treponema sp. R80B11-R83G3]
MKTKEKSAVCSMAVVLLFAVVLVLLPGCGKEEETPQVTVTFNLGYEGAQNTPGPITIAKNGTLGNNLPAPTRSGYEFAGWFSSNKDEYKAQTPIADNITLTAEWATLPPEEASLFDDVTLATPYKGYNDGNPVFTQNFGADPFALVYDNKVYIYMTGDTPVPNESGVIPQNTYDNINILRVVSSYDMVNWTEYPAIKAAGTQGAATWAVRSWAPAASYRNNDGTDQFFLYFANGSTGIGVLTSSFPTGPFTDPIRRALINSSTPNCSDVVWLFDPAVFIDDDGTGYIYFGGGTPSGGTEGIYPNANSKHPMPGTIRAAKLGADMTSLNGNPVTIPAPFSFEDNGCFKLNNTYYYTYCTNRGVDGYASAAAASEPSHADAVKIGKGMSIAYMTSDKPLEGFTLRNRILTNPGEMFNIRGGNNHHAIFKFKGKYYITYHSRLLANAMGLDDEGKASANGEGYRITHVDEVTITGDGTIQEVQGTRRGPAQVGRFNPYDMTSAATIGTQAGISTTPVSANGIRMKVTSINSGDWIALRGVDFGTGAKKFNCSVVPPASGKGVIQIKQDGLEGPAIGYVIVESGQTSITIDLLRTVYGIHDLVFVFYGEGYDFDQWKFLKQ